MQRRRHRHLLSYFLESLKEINEKLDTTYDDHPVSREAAVELHNRESAEPIKFDEAQSARQ